jgi:two-component system, chemotaxis family, CheB/CheR fusion protein
MTGEAREQQQQQSDDGAGGTPLDVLLAHLKRTRGFDFTGYKRTSLERRIRKRMDAVGVDGYSEYLDYLEVHQDEFPALFDVILINVTGFFRDPPAWEYYADEVIPHLLEAIGPEDPIRVWCAGCASGEETYTMAMVLAEAMGIQAFMERVKIYATEVDEDALNQARQASYTAKDVETIPPPLLERYFEQGDQRFTFRKDLRRSVIFGRNDLTQDAPISRIDLLTCRNTLMYFNAETQARILNRFHFALNPWGYLFLGKSEMLITHSDLFRPVNLKRRVFAKVLKPTLRERFMTFANATHELAGEPIMEIRDGAFETAPAAQIAVDTDGMLVLANAHARSMFGIATSDLGRPLKDLEISYRPVDLRSNLEVAFTERRTVSLTPDGNAHGGPDARAFEVQITPLRSGQRLLGATVIFQDVTRQRRVEDELETSKRELENAYEELQSTVEELETTNEELQSTNEELETTNEELQSANEELETMNEELQSTNEELETINDELRQRSLELNEVNAFLETILSSMGVAVIVIDREQRVQIWNAESTELWGVRSDEAQGQHLFGLDIGLPLDGVRPSLRRVLAGTEDRAEVELEALNRRGRQVRVNVTLLRLGLGPDDVSGVILLTAPMDGTESQDGADGGESVDGDAPN